MELLLSVFVSVWWLGWGGGGPRAFSPISQPPSLPSSSLHPFTPTHPSTHPHKPHSTKKMPAPSTQSTRAALKEDVPGFCFDNYARNASLPTEKGMHMPSVRSLSSPPTPPTHPPTHLLLFPQAMKTGTTIAGACFKDGVVLGADTRATGGTEVADKVRGGWVGGWFECMVELLDTIGRKGFPFFHLLDHPPTYSLYTELREDPLPGP